MKNNMHRVFISYHHDNDQYYKNELVRIGKEHGIFEDWSVGIDEIDDDLPDESIREIIRDDYLRFSTVTILLVGTETKYRKHVDWEVYSSMYDGKINKKSGIIVINLPSTMNKLCHATHNGEKVLVFPEIDSWRSVDSREEYEQLYPYMPPRIIDQWMKHVPISAIAWEDLTVDKLKYMVEMAYSDKTNCDYDLSRPMRRKNG